MNRLVVKSDFGMEWQIVETELTTQTVVKLYAGDKLRFVTKENV